MSLVRLLKNLPLCLVSTRKPHINTIQDVYAWVLSSAGCGYKAHSFRVDLRLKSEWKEPAPPSHAPPPRKRGFSCWVRVTSSVHEQLFDHVLWSLFNSQSAFFFCPSLKAKKVRLWWAWMQMAGDGDGGQREGETEGEGKITRQRHLTGSTISLVQMNWKIVCGFYLGPVLNLVDSEVNYKWCFQFCFVLFWIWDFKRVQELA